MRITKVEPTELFAGTAQRPVQLVRVTLVNAGLSPGTSSVTGPQARVSVRIEGPAVATPRPAVVTGLRPGQEHTAEVGVELSAPVTEGAVRHATVIAESGETVRAEAPAEIIAAVPGWTMWMVSHFHYDPVWWNTQGQFTETRLLLPDEHGKLPEFRTAFELVGLHLDMARRDPDYKFVLAEIDYLKPYFDAHPERRDELRQLLSQGRAELVGGNYNEANTNLTSAEATIRNAVYGIGYQRDVLRGDPATAWMLDVFGHDPSYPSLMAAAGLDSSAWARGPFHQWGPLRTVGDNQRMQFPSEFEWMSPDGSGLLTAYMPNHYGAGWGMERLDSLAEAEHEAYGQFMSLKPVAATRNVLLPVGADHVIPSRWSTQIHRDWNARYVWPRFVTALPSEFFAAVRADAATRGVAFTPQTRDMNPVYPGKDVSYIDTKQAQRAAETAVMDGERLATLAWLHGGAYPDAALDKAWRQLVYGGHHDAITGTESDQVYLDLLGGWREAFERGDGARRDAMHHLAGLADTSAPAGLRDPRAVVVFNTLAAARSGPVTVTLGGPRPGTGWLQLRDGGGALVPALAEGVRRHADGTLAEVTLTFDAADVPGLGYRTYWAVPAPAPPDTGWSPVATTAIENAAYRLEADPRRGGALSRILDKRAGTELITAGTELITAGADPGGDTGSPPAALANELLIQEEYDYHPRWNEGPWLLMPKGPGRGSAAVAADVRAERCPIGSRLVASWAMDDLRVTQETVLWDGARHVEFRTHVDGSIGHDRLLRVRFPLDVPGGLPVYGTAAAVIGRPFGATDTDVGQHWFTLDNPAYTWFGLGSTARVLVRETGGSGGRSRAEAIGVAEVITPDGVTMRHNGCRGAVRGLIAALAQQGVTATCARADGPRYGAIDLDSNLPDVRIAVGGPDVNGFTGQVLSAAGPAYGGELARQLANGGIARVWVPAARTRADAFVPGADVRGVRDLPVLIVAGTDLAAAVGAVATSLASAEIEAVTPGITVRTRAAGSNNAGGSGPSGSGASPGGAVSPRASTVGLAGWSAALLNRGTPGCVVTTDGTLNISLMRSCSGWPSGVWIDEPKRTAPDGSSFSWQHWSHTFEYALVSSGAGRGDWRDGGFPAAGEAYNHPLLARETGIHAGPLPAAASLFQIDVAGPGDVALAALKPRGNPAAAGQPGRAAWRAGTDAVTLRLRETSGRGARVRLNAAAGRLTDLLEERDGAPLGLAADGAPVASLAPLQTMTLLVVPGARGPAQPAGQESTGPAVPAGRAVPTATVLNTEPAQPVFTRYWLHGKGPAPAGSLPAAVHISPARNAVPRADAADATEGATVNVRITVSGGPARTAGMVELDVPAGLTAKPAGPLPYDLPAGAHAGWDVAVRPAGPSGRYFLSARIRDAAGQVLEDVATIAVGEEPVPPLDTPLDELLPRLEADQRATAAELDVTLTGGDLTLTPGERAQLEVRLANHARAQIRGEAQLVSPFGTWDAIAPWTQGFCVDPGSEHAVRYEVAAPAAARPGSQWWALVKVCYFGRLHYTGAIRVSIVV